MEVGKRALFTDVGTVRELCTDFDTTCWANCSCSLTFAPNTNTICMALAQATCPWEAFEKVLQVTALMQTLAFPEFAWLWIRTKASPVCRVTDMQLNAKGPGCKPQGSQLIPRPRFRQARLRTTPFGHAFRPRLSATPSGHVFPATPSGHVFRRTIRIEDVMHFAELAVPLIFGALQR